MSVDPETRQRLLELVYDLLSQSESAQLRRRIEAEPELAEAFAETQRTARLLTEAARLSLPKIALKREKTATLEDTGTSAHGAPKLPRKTPKRRERAVSTPSESPKKQVPIKVGRAARRPWARGANWAVGLATSLLLIVSIGGYLYHRDRLSEIAAGHIRLRVDGPSSLTSGVDSTYTIATTTVNGKGMASRIEFALYSSGGEQLFGHQETSDEQGHLRVTIPADKLPESGHARLEVLAVHQDKLQRVDTRVAVEPVRYATRLSLDKPLYRPGETVYYRSLTLSRFRLAADRSMPIHFEVLDPSGGIAQDSQQEGVTEHGVGSGAFAIPPGAAGGEYVLVARSLDEAFPEEKRPFFVRSYRLPRLKKELEFARDSYGPGDTVVADFIAERAEGGAAADARLRVMATVDGETVFQNNDLKADATGAFQVKFDLPETIDRGDGQLLVVVDDGGTQESIAKTIPINLGKVDVEFFPEGGDLVDGLENRVYFTCRDLLGEPVYIEGTIQNSSDVDVALVETTHEGMGAFSFRPRSEERYHLKITSPADVSERPKLPEVSTERKLILNTGTGVFAHDEPLEFNLRAAKNGMPIVVAASCRSVPVGQTALVTVVDPDEESEANAVVIPLAEGVGGVIRLTVYDYGVQPPEPVAERLVYRRQRQGLQVRAAGHDERYSPGERVEISLQVTDENNKPVPSAVLGVAVVDDALLSLADDRTPALKTHFMLATEIEKPEDLEDVDFYLGDDTEAAVALDLLLGTQGWRRFAEKTLQQLLDSEEGDEEDPSEQLTRLAAMGGPTAPPAMFDNLEEIRTSYQESLDAYHADRTNALSTLTTVSFFAGLGLVLLVAMLGLLRIVSGVHLWAPAVGVTTCCLIIGAILMDPARLGRGTDVAVAFQQFNAAPPEPLEDVERFDESATLEATEEEGVEWGVDADGEVFDFFVGFNDAAPPMPAEPEMPEEPMAGMPMGNVAGQELAELPAVNGMLFRAEGRGRDMNGWLDAKNLEELGDARRMLKQRILGNKPDGRWAERGSELEAKLAEFRFTVREYAHVHRPSGEPGVRSDFAETLYWHPLLVTDDQGIAKVAFDLSDSITTFRLRVDGHSVDADGVGRIGSGGGELISRIPFNLEPKLPLEVNAGDRIDLPLAVVNDSGSQLPVEITLSHGDLVTLEGEPDRRMELAADQRSREYFVLEVTGEKGDCDLTFRGLAGNLADAVSRPLKVVPPGFPKRVSYSGRIDGQQEIVVELPEYWVPGSLEVTLNAYPSTLADLQKGMDSILREPNGCFEQASTSNYPNVLSLQYMQENDVANPAVTRRAKDLLKKGYVKLIGYECPKEGYEWFGGDPGHEALTAYGLMEFRDMAEVYDVDPEMIQRTAEWLLERRDGKGGFKRNDRALDSFGRASEEITNAYIAWALSESGQTGIEAEIDQVVESAGKSDDPYLIALAAAGAFNAEKQSEAEKLLDALAELQAEDGHLEGTDGSITRSGGHSLKVETTALAALAWLKLPSYSEQATRAVQWIVESRQGSGGFGSTQATILALKALVEHSKANRKTLAAGTLVIKRDDMEIGSHEFGAGRQETIVIDGLEADLQSGENSLTINLSGDNTMPYSLDVTYRSRKPESDDACPVRLTTKLAETRIKAGETVAMTAELVNTTDEGQPMTI
ncbi:MAG: MG2 domain-containing protein, partial [Thermoguttaceae bacterium]